MAESNPFDQFDGVSGSSGSNPFDAFDPGKHAPGMPEWLFEHGQRANILSAFGQGAKEGFGAEPLGLSEESEKALRDSGMFNEINDGHKNWVRTINEAFIRPAAAGLDAAFRSGTALFRGTQAAIGAAGEFAEHPPPEAFPLLPAIPGGAALGRDVAAIREAAPRGIRTELGVPHVRPPAEPTAEARASEAAANQRAVLALTPPDLDYARSLGVIGEGEGGWKGTIESGPRGDEARSAAIKRMRDAAEEEPGLAEPGQTSAPQPTIHDTARQLAPDTFRQYDALGLQRDTLRRQIDDLDDMRRDGSSPAIADLDRQITEMRAGRLAEADRQARAEMANRITALEAERAKLADALPETGDTAEMAEARRQMAGLDYQMRDLAPDVADAYRRAQEPAATTAEAPEAAPAPEMPPSPEEVPTAAAPTVPGSALSAIGDMKQTPEGALSLNGFSAEERAALEKSGLVREFKNEAGETYQGVSTQDLWALREQRQRELAASRPAHPIPGLDIRENVRQQLIAAGRPAEEADAASALVAAHYDARAARFGGTKGSAADLYAADAPKIEAAARGRKGELGRTVIDDGQSTIRLMANADASTFVHETAHNWLEELLKDAADEHAPEDLTRDAKTVRDWLGAGEGEAIPTRGHEKFARGFERYLMEGRAPSSNLARVFDQFKGWLTQIYETVARLRAPITDDIRDVYNRLIALPGREPVIAPDMEIPKSFAEEHAAIAERTPPEFAHGAADRVRAEADRVALERAPEVYDELAGRQPEPGVSGAAPAGDETAAGEPRGHGAAAGAEPGAVARAEPTGAVGAGRGEAAPQGGGLVATAERPFIAPGTPASAGESRFADRAGNIRLDLLGTPEDVNQAIRDTAAQNDDFLGARRGVISDAEVLRLADALGMDAAKLDRRKIGQAFNAEQVVAARKLLIQSATAVRDAAADTSDEKGIMAFAAAADRHRMIQAQVAGITSEAGRALRAFRDLEGGKEAKAINDVIRSSTGRMLFQLRRLAQNIRQLQTPSQISKHVADAEKPGFFDWVQSYFVNGLISGPATHGTYMIANAELGLFKATAETGAAGVVGRAREAGLFNWLKDVEAATAAGGARVEFGEIPAQIFGAMYGQRRGWQAAWRAFLSGQTEALPGEEVASGTSFSQGVIPGIAGKVIETPSRGVAGLHTLTRVTSYESSIHGQAYRIATQEGLTGNAKAARINQLVTDPTEEMMAEAVKLANENALMQRAPYGSLTNKIQQVTNWGLRVPDLGPIPMGTLRPIKFVDPFVAISSNIIKGAVVERTPLGIFSQAIRDDLSGKNGTLAFDRTAGRMLAGTSFYLMAGGLAAEGLLTDSGPSDHRKAAMLRQTGWIPHGMKIGDAYYDMHRLGIMGMQMGIAADLWHIAPLLSSGDMSAAVAAAHHAFTQNIFDESFMRGPSEFIQAITDSDRYGPAFVRNFLSSFVPFSVGMSQIARTIDPYTRQARSILDAMLRKIPYGSETLEPMIDIWGNPIPNRESIIPGLTAIYESRINNDPVNQKMVALGMGPAMPKHKIDLGKIRGIELTPHQYTDYARNAGRLAKMRLDQIVRSPEFSLQSEDVQRDVISKTISAAREQTRGLILKMYPSIINQATAEKTAALRRPAAH